MGTAITRKQTPEERELEKKRAELAALSVRLSQRELDLATLEAELRAFEIHYLRTVGVRLAELDDMQAKIAEAGARLKPRSVSARNQAKRARNQARESADATGPAQAETFHDKFVPPDSLRRLYREVVKRVHPDLATDEADRVRRTKVMTEVNRCYEQGDESGMQALLVDWEQGPEAVKGEGPGAELIRLIRKIAQVEDRLAAIETKMEQLRQSDIYQLRRKVEEARADGFDLLDQMVKDLENQIRAAKCTFEGLGGLL